MCAWPGWLTCWLLHMNMQFSKCRDRDYQLALGGIVCACVCGYGVILMIAQRITPSGPPVRLSDMGSWSRPLLTTTHDVPTLFIEPLALRRDLTHEFAPRACPLEQKANAKSTRTTGCRTEFAFSFSFLERHQYVCSAALNDFYCYMNRTRPARVDMIRPHSPKVSRSAAPLSVSLAILFVPSEVSVG